MHSPLILCSMAFSTMVYLSACTFVLEGDLYRQAKDLVQVSIGTFKVYEEVWPISARTLGQIKATARGVFAPSNARPSPGNDILNPSIAATYSSKSTYTSQNKPLQQNFGKGLSTSLWNMNLSRDMASSASAEQSLELDSDEALFEFLKSTDTSWTW
jgi:hypothetical protein